MLQWNAPTPGSAARAPQHGLKLKPTGAESYKHQQARVANLVRFPQNPQPSLLAENARMAPSLSTLVPRGATFDASVPAGEFRAQWVTPADVFSVLLILGGDVVARAIAQLAGSGVAPVAFSFGITAPSPTSPFPHP